MFVTRFPSRKRHGGRSTRMSQRRTLRFSATSDGSAGSTSRPDQDRSKMLSRHLVLGYQQGTKTYGSLKGCRCEL